MRRAVRNVLNVLMMLPLLGCALGMMMFLGSRLVFGWSETTLDALRGGVLQYYQPTPTSTPTTPYVILNPKSGPSGTTVRVRGYNLQASTVVTLTWDSIQLPTMPATITTTGAGSFDAFFSVPAGSDGPHALWISCGNAIILTVFTLRSPTPTFTPSPTPTDTPTPTPGPVRGTPTFTPPPPTATPTDTPTPEPSPTPACTRPFEDDFLDPTLPGWGTDVGGGNVTVSGSEVHLTAGAVREFPLMWRNDVQGLWDDLRIRFRCEPGSGSALIGVGSYLDWVGWPPGPVYYDGSRYSEGDLPPERIDDVLRIERAADRFVVSLLEGDVTWLGDPGDTAMHTVEVHRTGITSSAYYTYTLRVDGNVIGSAVSAKSPVVCYLGNPVVLNTPRDWTGLHVDYIHTEQCYQPTPTPTWTPFPRWCAEYDAVFPSQTWINSQVVFTVTVTNTSSIAWEAGRAQVGLFQDAGTRWFDTGYRYDLPAQAIGESSTSVWSFPAPTTAGVQRYQLRCRNSWAGDDWFPCHSDTYEVTFIDAVPAPPDMVRPAATSWSNSRTVDFEWLEAAVRPGESPPDEYELRLLRGTTVMNNAIISGTTASYTYAADYGHLGWQVRAHNDRGWGRWSDVWVFGVDTIPPEVSAEVRGSRDGGHYVDRATVRLYASDPDPVTVESGPGSGVESIYYFHDGTWHLYQGEFDLTEGEHLIRYYAVDRAGNAGELRDLYLTIVAPPPPPPPPPAAMSTPTSRPTPTSTPTLPSTVTPTPTSQPPTPVRVALATPTVVTSIPAPTSTSTPTPTPTPQLVAVAPIPPTGVIEGVVFYDRDEDGVQDEDEPGIPDVRVTIRSSDDGWVKTVLTDGEGRYTFRLPGAGAYKIYVPGVPHPFQYFTTPSVFSIVVPRDLETGLGLRCFGLSRRILWLVQIVLLGLLLALLAGSVTAVRIRQAVLERNRLMLAIADQIHELERGW